MLPPDFHWQPYIDGPALYLGERKVAMLSPLAKGSVRICLNPTVPALLRYEFFDSQARAMAYVEAWARKWEVELRGG